jgi:hypothetical protein
VQQLHPHLGFAPRRLAERRRVHRVGWAAARKVPKVIFNSDWARRAEAAPFRRNDQLLQTMPIGAIVFLALA